MIQIKEKPILFSAPMVRAILEGEKTQTRRIMKQQPIPDSMWGGGFRVVSKAITVALETFNRLRGAMIDSYPTPCPYGKPGDRLWVRETFCWSGYAIDPDEVLYRADEEYTPEDRGDLPWKPSIHMPRWASRILLEIVSVRVERLQDISEQDAKAEGCDNSKTEAAIATGWYEKPRSTFHRLWEQINGADSWNDNPWVWVVEFKKIN